jgi:polyisoprenoid-binding protein YceI
MNARASHFSVSLLVMTSAFAAALSACDNDPGKGKPHAEVRAPQPATDTAAGAVEHAFSAADSKIEFTGAKVTGKHDGSFGSFRGTVWVQDGDPTRSSVNVEIDMASLKSDADKLTTHLKSADFFDVAVHPTAKFVSTDVKAGGEGGATHTVTGNLEMHGVTKSITFPATIKIAADTVETDAEFAINRQDFGVAYPGMPDDLIKDEILIRLTIRAKKAA